MNRGSVWALACALVATGCGKDLRSAREGLAGKDAGLDQFITGKMADAKTPGLAVGIVKGGRLVMSHGYGFANLEQHIAVDGATVFRMASVSKTVVATAVLQQVEAGKLVLDQSIASVLPFKVVNPTFPDTAITLRMLLTHTSSIHDRDTIWDEFTVNDKDAPESLGDFLKGYLSVGGVHYDAANDYLAKAPGTAYEYSNVAIALAAYMVEVVAKEPFDSYCASHIFSRLAMNETTWHVANAPADSALPYQTDGAGLKPRTYSFPFYPSGGLHTNVPDLTQHLMMVMAGGATTDTNRLLTLATIAEMEKPQIPALDPSQGLIWYSATVNGAKVYGHTGGNIGVATRMFFNPITQTGVVVLANHDPEDLQPLKDIEARLFDEASHYQ